MRTYPIACAVLVTCAACGGDDDEVSYSEPVGIKMKADSDDLDGGRINEDKNINTESGNPYGVFIENARAAVGGDPSAIRVDEVTLTLDAATSTNVAELGLVFSGQADVSFEMNSGEVYLVASHEFTAEADAGPVAFDVHLDSDAITDVDYADLLGGGFKVLLAAEAAAGFDALDASADLEVTFLFTALD